MVKSGLPSDFRVLYSHHYYHCNEWYNEFCNNDNGTDCKSYFVSDNRDNNKIITIAMMIKNIRMTTVTITAMMILMMIIAMVI